MRTQTLPAGMICFFLSFFVCTVLAQAFPYGFVFPDTASYLQSAEQVTPLGSAHSERTRTPGFGLVLMGALQTPEPTRTVLFVNAILFSLCISGFARLVAALSKSQRIGLLAGSALLLFEVMRMRTFLSLTLVLSDPLYSLLLFLGTVTALRGWVMRMRREFFLGIILIGIAAFVRPLGAPLLLWVPLCIAAGFHFAMTHRAGFRTMFTSLLLLLGPTLLWSLHTTLVYTTPLPNSLLGLHLTLYENALYQKGDVVFDDPALDNAFSLMMESGIVPPDHTAPDPFGVPSNWPEHRMVQFFGSLTPVFTENNGNVPAQLGTRYCFEISRISIQVAKRLILRHPQTFIRILLARYVKLFSPYALGEFLMMEPERSPAVRYSDTFFSHAVSERTLRQYYPPDGRRELTLSSERAYQLLSSIGGTPSKQRIDAMHPSLSPRLLHVIALIAFVVFCMSRLKNRWAFVSLVFFATTSLHALITAGVTTILDRRFALPGEMSMDALLLISAITIIIWIMNSVRRIAGRK